VVARAFAEHFGSEVLNVRAATPPHLSIFAHCGRGAATVAFLVVNVGNRTEALTLPRHGAGPVVLSLAGASLKAPAFAPSRLEARTVNAALLIKPFSATVAIVGRLAAPPATCRRPAPEHTRSPAAPVSPLGAAHRSKKKKKHRGWFSR
jgi:hypothetical protein